MDEIKEYLEWKSTHTVKAPIPYKLHLKRFKDFARNDLREMPLNEIVRFTHILKQKYSAANVAYSLVILKNFYEYWRRQGSQCIDPFLIKPPKFITHSHVAVLQEDFSKLDSLLGENLFTEIRLKVVLHLLWYTGIRVSELCDLNISDLDLKKNRAQIVTKKNNKLRWIFWPEETGKLLKAYLGTRLCLNQKPALFIALRKGKRERVAPRSVQRWIKEIVKKAGVTKKISPHSFRHGRAHRILDCGGGVKDIQMILGHSENNPIASFSYLRLNPRETEKRARRLF